MQKHNNNNRESIVDKTLILGAGGGYDIYTCLPWYLNLTKEEKAQCILANYSFTDDLYKYEDSGDGDNVSKWIVKINKNSLPTKKNEGYFPELHLAKSLDINIHAIRLIPNPLLETELTKFILTHGIKKIILVDGGVDACLYGDEYPFGSPLEDSQTIIAAYRIAQKHSLPCFLMCSALWVDEVQSDKFLKHWDEMCNVHHGFKCYKVKINNDANFALYNSIVASSHPASIIQESIIAAVEGKRGRYNNPRLFPDRIEDPACMPDLHDDTAYLWWMDVRILISLSPFYKKLLEVKVEINAKNETVETVKSDEEIHKIWWQWDKEIGKIFKCRRDE